MNQQKLKNKSSKKERKSKISEVKNKDSNINLMMMNSMKIKLQKQYINKKRINCPICNKWIFELAQDMKIPQKSLSFLYCSSTGELLNEENPPLISPDYIVFGLEYIDNNVKINQGSFICPFTENIFLKNEFRKLYI